MKLDLPKIEIKTLKFWEEKKIFEKSLEKNKKKEKFVFYEGPPFANGLPGIHHLLARAFKDIILR
jgi:isoleucyl-tRNA synthetase